MSESKEHNGNVDDTCRQTQLAQRRFGARIRPAMALAGSVGQLVSMGWRRETLAFFHAMPIGEIQEMLPLAAKDWVEEDYLVLLREAKRQRRWMDVEDNLFYQHQRLLYKDTSVIDARIAELPTAVAEAGATLALARKALPRVTWKTRLQKALAGASGSSRGQRSKRPSVRGGSRSF